LENEDSNEVKFAFNGADYKGLFILRPLKYSADSAAGPWLLVFCSFSLWFLVVEREK